ncbi:hypothetical protein M2145_001897 [Lachnospiraceae bacterium PF1-21]|uniref:Uncharacterized protein n=1 Tax=Ohessyouella blattaphilus TaxID=2949333 RepID=A0ABT1EKA9_9FIRM|nr:hypothetical protein [Ohessyouella blattaphilus]MCP1110929.1 hypothetical protein [Ohessyouella blattaphilus]MCR8564323.1 hypothetical protein [Ohessyouella blattaphilus]MDL2250669.1 hypothetical protein [Lachnospiraceae bacterium OttesenSCG-928-J05]
MDSCWQADERVKDRLGIMAANGVEIVELSPETFAEMRQLSADLYQNITEQSSPELVKHYVTTLGT